MIQLFNVPNYKIDTSIFSNLLHDKIVTEFEEEFAAYVGAKYAVSFNSATSAIFLLMKALFAKEKKVIGIPAMIPPVVANAIINAGYEIHLNDNVKWVGDSYLFSACNYLPIVDSAQKVERNQFIDPKNIVTCIIYSFYPTKPISGCDGGMIVTDTPLLATMLRKLSMNGMTSELNNWERTQNVIGHKMYMNSIQATIALANLRKLDEKKEKLHAIRLKYNDAFGLNNTSDHLYRINIKLSRDSELWSKILSRRDNFIENGKINGITFGIHYKSIQENILFHPKIVNAECILPNTKIDSATTISIPFHEKLTAKEIDTVIKFVLNNQ